MKVSYITHGPFPYIEGGQSSPMPQRSISTGAPPPALARGGPPPGGTLIRPSSLLFSLFFFSIFFKRNVCLLPAVIILDLP